MGRIKPLLVAQFLPKLHYYSLAVQIPLEIEDMNFDCNATIIGKCGADRY